jgi:hypothetical protein
MICPYCALENPSGALVCGNCSRDIAVPESLIAERDDLLRKRGLVQKELDEARRELQELRRRTKYRSS